MSSLGPESSPLDLWCIYPEPKEAVLSQRKLYLKPTHKSALLSSFCIVATEYQIWWNDSWLQSMSSTHFARWVLKSENIQLWVVFVNLQTYIVCVCIPSKEYTRTPNKKWWYTAILGMFLLPWPNEIFSAPLYYKPILCSTLIVSGYKLHFELEKPIPFHFCKYFRIKSDQSICQYSILKFFLVQT